MLSWRLQVGESATVLCSLLFSSMLFALLLIFFCDSWWFVYACAAIMSPKPTVSFSLAANPRVKTETTDLSELEAERQLRKRTKDEEQREKAKARESHSLLSRSLANLNTSYMSSSSVPSEPSPPPSSSPSPSVSPSHAHAEAATTVIRRKSRYVEPEVVDTATGGFLPSTPIRIASALDSATSASPSRPRGPLVEDGVAPSPLPVSTPAASRVVSEPLTQDQDLGHDQSRSQSQQWYFCFCLVL